MLYDALSYTTECKTLSKVQGNVKWTADEYLSRTKKGTALTPIFTLVLYTGEKAWDGPKSLYEMLRIDERLKPFVPDHPLNLIDLGHDKDIRFKTTMLQDLTAALQAVYGRDFNYGGMIDNRALSLAGILANDKDLYAKANENKGGVTKMCDALRELREMGRAEGRAEGEAEIVFELVKENLITAEIASGKLGMTLEIFSEKYKHWLEIPDSE